MNLSELIAAVGDASVRFQKIDDCAESMNLTKHGSRVTFVTPERFGINGFDKLGLVVWIDRDAAAKAVADLRRARTARSPQMVKKVTARKQVLKRVDPKVDAVKLAAALNAKKSMVCDFAIIDIKAGRGAVADHFDKLPGCVGPIPDEFKVPFVLSGHLNGINSGNDGESQEFSAHVDRIEFDAKIGEIAQDAVVQAVRTDLLERSKVGIAKYGKMLTRTDLSHRDWLQHTYEEALDFANYLKRSIMEIDNAKD